MSRILKRFGFKKADSDILFFHCPVTFSKKTDLILDHPLMGSMCLAAVLEKEGYKVEIFENRDRYFNLRESVKYIESKNPKILALSSFTSNIRGNYQLAVEIKKNLGEKITIALGGPHVSADFGIVNRFPVFDFCVTQEAEITLPKLVEKIVRKKEKVRGVFKGEVPKDLDIFPLPARHLVDWSRYKGFRTHNIMASRGCPFHCVFCSIPSISRVTRYRCVNLVVDEIQEAQKYVKSNWFTFIDDTLTFNKEFMMQICEEIIYRGIKIKFEGHTRANLIDEEVIKKMKKAGCEELIFGVESGNERVRNEVIKKGVKDSDIFKAIKICKKYGIKADIYLMIGFPSETEKEMMDTINYPRKVKPNVFGIHITVPLPGADIWETSIKEGIISKDTIDRYIKGELGEGFNENWPVYIPKWASREKLEKLQFLAYKKYYFRPEYIFEKLLSDITSISALKTDFGEVCNLLKMGHASYLE